MRTSFLAATRATALLVSAGMAAGPASAVSFKACSGSYAPDGTPGGGFYSRIMAKRITCAAAKKVTRAWITSHADGTATPRRRSRSRATRAGAGR